MTPGTTRTWTPVPPPYHQAFLEAVGRLIVDGARDHMSYQLAVVLAQAACEVLVEQLLDAQISKVQPESVRDWIADRAKHRNDLSDERDRKLYSALTGDEINAGKGFWQEYTKHGKRRHDVVHAGKAISKEEAMHSYDTVRRVVAHLLEVQRRLTNPDDASRSVPTS